MAAKIPRVAIAFADSRLRESWLRVTILSGDQSDLAQFDAFYFGNAAGETAKLDSAVKALDLTAPRAAERTGKVTLHDTFDFNRRRRQRRRPRPRPQPQELAGAAADQHAHVV